MNIKNNLIKNDYSFSEIQSMAEVFFKSGYFKDIKSMTQAVVKIMAGREIDMLPFAAMQSFHIIEGKPVLTGHACASLIKDSGKYDYRIVKSDNNSCEIDFFNKIGEKLGTETFSMEDAKIAGLIGKDNWKKYPRAMLFNRAIAEGYRKFCPDAAKNKDRKSVV